MTMIKEDNTVGAKQPTYFNPFEEMMMIEAEFGSLFDSHEDLRLEKARNASKWFPLLETIQFKGKEDKFGKILDAALKTKEASQ